MNKRETAHSTSWSKFEGKSSLKIHSSLSAHLWVAFSLFWFKKRNPQFIFDIFYRQFVQEFAFFSIRPQQNIRRTIFHIHLAHSFFLARVHLSQCRRKKGCTKYRQILQIAHFFSLWIQIVSCGFQIFRK